MSRALALALAPAGLVVLGASLAIPWLFRTFQLGALLWPAIEFVKSVYEALPEDVRKYLTGSFVVTVPIAIISAVGGVCYKLYGAVMTRFRHFLAKNCQVTMCFKSVDKHYDIVIDYIGSRCCVETGRILASTQPRSRPSFQEMLAGWLGGKTKAPSLYFQPDIQEFASYFHWSDEENVKHKIWLSRHVEKPQFRSDSGKEKRDPETITLTMWWTTDSQVLKSFLATALKTMMKDDGDGTVDIYVKHMWLPMWTKAISREKRDRDTVILDEGLADYVVEDMRNFFTKRTADWYHNAGIPYRRGYLLYGPPGCGKTSFAQVLAGELGLDVCLMNLSNSDMNDDDLAELLRAAPARSMLLLEDVDAIFVERAAAADKKSRGGGVSFSGLLNALDGAAAQEGCVITLTTNHKDRLDEALIRPGRCDVHVIVEKASKEQAKRMFWRFFAKEATIKSIEKGVVNTTAAHGLHTGDAVVYKRARGAESTDLDRSVFYVSVEDPGPGQARLKLYDSLANARAGGAAGLLMASDGKGARLQEQNDAGVRFGSRIPDKQVSMAKLQGYLMKQKLLAEQEIKRQGSVGLDDECGFRDAVWRVASETAVMNVHELLDMKVEAVDVTLTVYDHFRRVGLHRYAPFFEHFGIREKKDIQEDVVGRMESWHPLFKAGGTQHERLVQLIKGEKSLDPLYDLADLSVLRDRFLSTYQTIAKADTSPPQPIPTAPPQPIPLQRCWSEPGKQANGVQAPSRAELLRATSGVKEDTGLKLLEMAHLFQERLEVNGKTNVSIWQLDMHFARYSGDPAGALENCGRLCHSSAERKPEELQVQWMTTFEFLRRIGLEEHAFDLEDAGFKLWQDWKHLGKDEIKEKANMGDTDAAFCHAVLTGNKERSDLLRHFQTPEFRDLVEFFRARFPSAPLADARHFGVLLTDELGFCNFSCWQVEQYLKHCESHRSALSRLDEALPSLAAAEAARKRPEPPPPRGEPEDWVHGWLKAASLAEQSSAFLDQALSTRDDVLGAPLDHAALQEMGIKKLGERCKILRMIKDLQQET